MVQITIIVIEDNDGDWELILDFCKDCEVDEKNVIRFKSLKSFQGEVNKRPFDLMIADLRLGTSLDDRTGWDTIKTVLRKEIIPIIVYSGFANEEPPEEYKNLIIKLILKGSGEFQITLKKFIALKQKIITEKNHVFSIFNDFTLETVGKVLQQENNIAELNENTLAFMVRSRLFSYLMNVPTEGEGKFPPESIFIFPPLKIDPYPEKCLFLGDFLEKSENGESKTLWFVISPSCDTIFTASREAKVKGVLLLRCYRKHNQVPFLIGKEEKTIRLVDLKNRVSKKTHKILKCPKQIFNTNYLLVSFKDYETVSYEEIKNGPQNGNVWIKIATLATPYSESLQNLFIKDFSRIGTPVTVTTKEEEEWIDKFVS